MKSKFMLIPTQSSDSAKMTLLLGLIIAMIGALGLIGWIQDITLLKSVFPGLRVMLPPVALSILFIGIAITSTSYHNVWKIVRLSTIVICVIVLLIAVLTLSEDIFGWSPEFSKFIEFSYIKPMSSTESFALILIVTAILVKTKLMNSYIQWSIVYALSTVTFFIGSLTIMGYASQYFFNFYLWNISDLSLNAAIAYILMGIALFSLASQKISHLWELNKVTIMGFSIGVLGLVVVGIGFNYFYNQIKEITKPEAYTTEVANKTEKLIRAGASRKPIINSPVDFKIIGTALMVDDESELLEIAAAHLEEIGFQVFQAKNASIALEIADREKNIDLLVTDVIMPGMNGIELAEIIHQKIPTIRIVYSSCFPSSHLSESKGIILDGLLISKPYQRNEFSSIIREAMNGHFNKLANREKEKDS